MIRAWRARRRRPARQLVDAAVVVTAQIDVRDGQIEGLRDALAEANRLLAEERAARARDVAQLRAALAPYLAQEWARRGARAARRLAEEPTVRARAMGRAPGWKGSATERWER